MKEKKIHFLKFKKFINLAPHGYQISIEFRDQFSLEDSPNCAYDYLEIRDGAYGYSSPLAKLCGPDFPRDIISNDRYLFLRFVSDDSIEYQGFRAVYSFIKMTSKLFSLNNEQSINIKTNIQMKDQNHQMNVVLIKPVLVGPSKIVIYHLS